MNIFILNKTQLHKVHKVNTRMKIPFAAEFDNN